MTNPCKRDCPDRSGTCHAECMKYLAYAAECERIREERHMSRIPTGYIVNEVRKSKRNSREWRNK